LSTVQRHFSSVMRSSDASFLGRFSDRLRI
jgi:hypothetical protein